MARRSFAIGPGKIAGSPSTTTERSSTAATHVFHSLDPDHRRVRHLRRDLPATAKLGFIERCKVLLGEVSQGSVT